MKRVRIRQGAAAAKAWREDRARDLDAARRVYEAAAGAKPDDRRRRLNALFFAVARLDIPDWIRNGLLDELRAIIGAQRGLQTDRVDLERYVAVVLARWRGVPWDDAWDAAADDLARRQSFAARGAEAIRKSYNKIAKLFDGCDDAELAIVNPTDYHNPSPKIAMTRAISG